MSKHITLIVIFLLLISANRDLAAQHSWQKPPPLKKQSEVEKIIGPIKQTEPSRDLKIVTVWGEDPHHDKGYHEYEHFKDLWTSLLKGVPRVTVEAAFQYPSPVQWKSADLIVFYVHLGFLTDEHYQLMDPYLERGGGIVAIHESVIQRPTGDALAKRWGLAWNEGTSQWGLLPTPVKLNTQHEILFGFPDEIEFVEEFYWKLTGDIDQIDVLGVAQAGPPEETEGPHSPEELDGQSWPVIWTVKKGPGRIFGTVLGHNFFSYKDPFFRIILFRAMAWTLHESFDPFKPLVTEGIALSND